MWRGVSVYMGRGVNMCGGGECVYGERGECVIIQPWK